MFIVKYAQIWLTIGILFVITSLFSFLFFGLNLGMDFTGGSVINISLKNTVEENVISDLIKSKTEISPLNISLEENNTYKIEFKFLSQDELEKVITSLEENYKEDNEFKVVSKYTVSPSIGKELQNRALIAIGLVLITIIGFITYVFKGISYPVPSFYYGLIAIVALVHDIIIPIGIFSYLSSLKIVEIDTLFIIALLSILGSSVNDTIVIFDRIRENILKIGGDRFEKVVAKSVSETLTRSINTTLSILFMLGSIIYFGEGNIKFFALALFIGLFFGTYSSIFLASPLLIMIYKKKFKK